MHFTHHFHLQLLHNLAKKIYLLHFLIWKDRIYPWAIYNLHLNENEKKAADLVNQLKTNYSGLEKVENEPAGFIFVYIFSFFC